MPHTQVIRKLRMHLILLHQQANPVNSTVTQTTWGCVQELSKTERIALMNNYSVLHIIKQSSWIVIGFSSVQRSHQFYNCKSES